jgi:hypothetical protein
MSDPSARRCALPECQEIIEEIPGRPFRKYCCAAHRAAARKLRLEQSYQDEPPVPTDFSGVDDTAPVPSIPIQAAPPQPDLLPSRDADQERDDFLPAAFIAQPWEPAQAWEPAGSKSSSGGHDARNGSNGKNNGGKGKSKDASAPLSPTFAEWLPSLPEYTPPPASDAASAASRRKRKEAAALARKRAVAVLGAFGILAGGGSWVVTNQTAPVAQAPQAAGPRTDTPKVDPAAWAVQARDALSSVNQQLDLIAQTEQLWRQAATATGATVLPSEMRALLARRSMLTQQQALLQSQLSAYQSMGTTSSDLAAAQQRLAGVDQALRALPAGPMSPQQQAAREQLLQQRAQAQEARDSKQKELATLQGGVENAVHAPLPDTGPDHTRSVVQSVVDLAEGKQPSKAPEDPAQRESQLAIGAPRTQGSPERKDTFNAAPPNPRGVEDGLVAPPSRSDGQRSGPVRDTVGDAGRTVRDVGGGTAREVGDTLRDTGGSVREVGDTVRDTGGSVHDVVDDVTEPVGGGRSRNSGRSGDDGGSSDDRQDSPRGQSDRNRGQDDALPTDEVGDQLTDEQKMQQRQDALKLVSQMTGPISDRLRRNQDPRQRPEGLHPNQGPQQRQDGLHPNQRPDASMPTQPDGAMPDGDHQAPRFRHADQDVTGAAGSRGEAAAGRQGTGTVQTVTARRPSGETNGAAESARSAIGQSNTSRPNTRTAMSDDASSNGHVPAASAGQRGGADADSATTFGARGDDSLRRASAQENGASNGNTSRRATQRGTDNGASARDGAVQTARAAASGSEIKERIRSEVNKEIQKHQPALDKAKKYQATAKEAVDKARRTYQAATYHGSDNAKRLSTSSTNRSEKTSRLRSSGNSTSGKSFFSRSNNGDSGSGGSPRGRGYSSSDTKTHAKQTSSHSDRNSSGSESRNSGGNKSSHNSKTNKSSKNSGGDSGGNGGHSDSGGHSKGGGGKGGGGKGGKH